MSDLTEKLTNARSALVLALGDNTQTYFDNLRMWFRHKWTKEEFDIQSRALLTTDRMHLHHAFLNAILNKIDAVHMSQQYYQQAGTTATASTPSCASSSRNNRKRKRSSRTTADRVNFESHDILDFVLEDSLECIRPPNLVDDTNQSIPTQRYCVQELFLPDLGFIMGRMLISAWEVGLMSVDDAVAEYVATAVQILLKNIVTEIILKRKHYKITGEGSFFYDVGAPFRDPFLKNTVARQKIDDGPLELDKEITSANMMRRSGNDETAFLSGCENPYPQNKAPIGLWDVYNALKNKNIIPSHSLYSINMERLTQLLQ